MTGLSSIGGDDYFGYIFPSHKDSHCLTSNPIEAVESTLVDSNAGIDTKSVLSSYYTMVDSS